MRRSITRACAAMTAGAALGGLGILGAGAAGAAGTPGAAAAAGTQLWAARYDGPAHGFDAAGSVAVTGGGGKVFVTGQSGSTATTIGYDTATGKRLWVKRYPGPADHGAAGRAVAVSPDGGTVFVTGSSDDPVSGEDYVTIAYNAVTGARLWLARYSGPGSGSDGAAALAVSPGGATVYVTGRSQGTSSGYDYATIAYNAATGAVRWTARYNGPGNGYDAASAVAIGPGGSRVFVTGTSTGAVSAEDYATIAYDAGTGAQLWVARYGGPEAEAAGARSVTVGPGGGKVFVTGTSGATAATVAYDARNGDRQWARRYPGQDDRGASGAAVAASPGAGLVFVAATSGRVVSDDYATLAYNVFTGARAWLRLYNGPGNSVDGATALAVSPAGGALYVTGTSSGGSATGGDYATVAYTEHGSLLWVRRYNGPVSGDDLAAAVAVSSAGRRIFVTGQSIGKKVAGYYAGFDYATVACSG